MIDTKIYKATLFAALLVIILALFSLKSEPKPHVSALAPDAFDSVRAFDTLKGIVDEYPDRRPGSEGDEMVGDLIDAKLAGLGFEVERQEFEDTVDGRTRKMSNVIGVLRGDSEQTVVVMAHRDAERVGEAISGGTGTAVLIELATVLSSVRHRKTITLVSTDGATEAGAGARYFAENLGDKGRVDGIFVLDNLGAKSLRQPFVVPWSESDVFSPLVLERTAERAVKVEVGREARGFGTVEQLIRLAFPLALQEQGILLAEGLPAVTISSRGELPPALGSGALDSVSRVSFSKFGKASLAALLALDGAQSVDKSPDRYVFFAGRVMPGWAVRLLAIALLMPVAFVSIDAFARSMRRRLPISRELIRVMLRSLPFLIFLLGSYLFLSTGLLPEAPSGAFNPLTLEASFSSMIGWAVLACVSVGVYFYSRRLVGGRTPQYDSRDVDASGVALSLVLVGITLAVWLVNPFTALLLLPAVHMWMLVPNVDVPWKRLVLPIMVVAGLAGFIAILIYYATRFDLGLSVFHYFGLLYAGRSVSIFQAFADCLMAGCLVTVLVIVWNRAYRQTTQDEKAPIEPAAYG